MTEVEIRARDAALCRCGHLCISHGSFDADGEFVGVGMAECNHDFKCDCQRFVPMGGLS